MNKGPNRLYDILSDLLITGKITPSEAIAITSPISWLSDEVFKAYPDLLARFQEEFGSLTYEAFVKLTDRNK